MEIAHYTADACFLIGFAAGAIILATVAEAIAKRKTGQSRESLSKLASVAVVVAIVALILAGIATFLALADLFSLIGGSR